jgi:hypothetical protein
MDGIDARKQLFDLERLRHVVVGTGPKTDDAIVHGSARRQHEDWHRRLPVSKSTAEGEAVPVGQHPIEHDHVEGARREGSFGFCKRARDEGEVTRLAQHALQKLSKLSIVFDHQQVHEQDATPGLLLPHLTQT